MAGLVLRNVKKSYGSNPVIHNLSLEIEAGEFVTLLGPSGCGKTTLLRMIAGLEEINDGELYIGGKLMNGLPPQKRPIGMVFQSYALFPHMTVEKNILFGLKVKGCDEAEIYQKLEWVLPMLRLEEYRKRLPRELSGGQRQRVALARALVLDPEVLLLDEPLSNLDAALREMATEELKRIHQKVGKTIVYVTHNQQEAMLMSGRIAVMRHGWVEQFDTPAKLYDAPETIFAAQFIGSPVTNTFEGEIKMDSNAIAYLDSEIGRINLYNHPEIDWDRYQGQVVDACVRPQDLMLLDERSKEPEPGDTVLRLRVEMVETPGDRSLVVAYASKEELQVRFFVNRKSTLTRGDLVSVVVPGTLVHLFSKATRKNLLVE